MEEAQPLAPPPPQPLASPPLQPLASPPVQPLASHAHRTSRSTPGISRDRGPQPPVVKRDELFSHPRPPHHPPQRDKPHPPQPRRSGINLPAAVALKE